MVVLEKAPTPAFRGGLCTGRERKPTRGVRHDHCPPHQAWVFSRYSHGKSLAPFASLCDGDSGLFRRLYSRGEQPMSLLKAVLKAASDSYPGDGAMAEIVSLEFSNLSPANATRQCVRYFIGGVPTVSLNFRAKADRDMPACSASGCKVLRCASPDRYCA